VYAYGFLRFVLEIWRDDVERGSYGPTLDAHVYVPLCMLLFAIAFVFGISLGIANKRARTVARVLAFVPPVVAYLALKPASFGQAVAYQLSTSQLIGVLSALAVAFFYARFWEEARKNPRLALSLGDEASIRALKGESAPSEADEEQDEGDEEADEADEKPAAAPAKTGKGKKKGLAATGKKATDEADEDDDEAEGEPEPRAT
jgi:phosphatidylglycerol:prolipoprotein diacylglycerol transferase